MNFDELMHSINTEFLKHSDNQRYGQFIMNYLTQNHPGIFAGMPEECDCFYDNDKIPILMSYLYERSTTKS